MSSIDLYNALRSAGVDDALARSAADHVLSVEDAKHLATKADVAEVKAALGELKADLTWRIILAMGAQTALLGTLMRFLTQ